MALRIIRLRGKVTIQDEQPKILLIMIMVLVTLMIVSTIWTYQTNTIMDYLRLILTIVVIILFYLLRDGVGEEGVSITGKHYIWDDINAWDYGKNDKGTSLYFTMNNQKEDKDGKVNPKIINLSDDKAEEAIKIIKNYIPKKYKRMRKS